MHDQLAARERQVRMQAGEIGPLAQREAMLRQARLQPAARERRAERLLPEPEDEALEPGRIVEADRAVRRRLHDREDELAARRLQAVYGGEQRGGLLIREVHEQA